VAARQAYSDAEVTALVEAYHRTGAPPLRERIVEEMRPLVRSVARKFAGREPLEDLESEGYVGLLRAVDRYAPGRGTRFSTFALHLIAGQIRHYLRDRGHLIRQPAWLQELSSRVQRASALLEQQLQRAPTVEEIAAATNLSEDGIEELLAARQAAQTVRLEAPAGGEDDDYLEVDPEKFRSRDYHTFEIPVEDRIVLEGALVKLKELERNVLQHFYFQDLSQSEIARKLGISCNYAGHVLRNGLKHMRERLPQDSPAGGSMSASSGEDSVMDPLTGVYNREHFERRLDEEVSRAQYYGRSVSVCCLRLPAASSEGKLEGAAQFLRTRTRKADVVGRTAPREFGVIFPNTGEVAEQVAARLAEQLVSLVGGPVHVAAASYPGAGRTAQQLLAAARGAVYLPALPAERELVSG
jgi:RNA polymerase sigma-B factor